MRHSKYACFSEEAFIPYIDALPSLIRNVDGPFMMPIVDKYADMGTVVMGKVESGKCSKGQTLAIYPNRVSFNLSYSEFNVLLLVSGRPRSRLMPSGLMTLK
jgi:translation elongation factor EF-1alpha